ncbi:MAG: bifunctional glutamate N-acetyltransferase/amino-acid acetyltransferase ArgJ [SAR202 cluster bacterium]|nr:bifunctional ornithine acetyltransferase/N-acetylglutamate synthase [Chloroflexota bacterium]MDP6419701.1 bifunctional glutamate N-acetyltransferase/amino-acid acetyltransferase ArgJ [SAR202 cluster bacterium]MQG67662.1 bifunctional glutamate N-acetyltransferase/amino-acid acetyltransferase ArgJ [SAR202 cluster bacterium]
MADNVKFIPGGTVTSSKGYRAGGTYAGLKSQGPDVRDLGILVSDEPASVAGTFSRNKILSPSVTVTKEKSANGSARGVVANSGCANCSVGKQGYTDAMEMTALAAEYAGVGSDEMLVGSTGMIGVELPMALVRRAVGTIELTTEGGEDFARSIMTTDSRIKSAAVTFSAGGAQSTIGGAAKGVGMIHPDMATMLCFLSSDAAVEPGFLQTALSNAVGLSFNMIDIDGDQSTNDTVLLFANDAAGGEQIDAGSDSASVFQEALNEICIHLAKEMVRDGEGAERIFEVTVDGATSVDDARVAAREIASSNLVKAMVHGRDPNWGRIMMALGKSGIDIDESKIDIYINGIHIVHDGIAIPYSADAVIAGMGAPEISFRVSVGVGDADATGWGCDLTEEYVTFNSAYST